MQHSVFQIDTPNQLHLFGQQWLPDNKTEIKAVVCLMHGLGDHSGRYQTLVNGLIRASYAMVALDQIGHGKSEGQRGHVRQYDDLMDTIALLLAKAKGDYHAIPIFLLGHSWGGNQVINFALRRKPVLAGVVAMSPWLELAFKPPIWKLWLGKGMNSLFPSFSQPNGLVVDFISRDPAVRQAYVNDPLVHNKISARLFTHTHLAAEWALAHAQEFPLPLLLIHGSKDGLISVEGTKAFARQLNNNAVLRVFEGMYHETHNDIGKEAVIKMIIQWLDDQLVANSNSAR
jgi:alpha-beta hydrolase superfamily lysophospholipase